MGILAGHILHQTGSAARSGPSARQPSASTSPPLPHSCHHHALQACRQICHGASLPCWCQRVGPNTGVTGPYMALFGVSTFLASKEYFVMEHDFYVGIGLAIVLTYLVKTQGPAYTAEINKQLDEEEAALKAIRQD